MASPVNIIFLVSDQHNAKVLGHKGHPDVLTPYLDRMAQEGVRCDNAITQSPICTPSRMSFLSGQYAHNHGYFGLNGPKPIGLPNIFSHFKSVGYLTAAIGKIHCPVNWVEDEVDIYCNTCATNAEVQNPEYVEFLRSRDKIECDDHGKLYEFGPAGSQSMESRPSKLTFDECQEGWIADKTVRTMREAVRANKPFVIHASFPRPHQCTSPCQEFWDLYEGKPLTLPENADWDLDKKAPNLKYKADWWRSGRWALIEPKTFEAARVRKLTGYLGAISQVDAGVGLILDHLRNTGLADNTIVIFTSDHGDFACEHSLMEKNPGISSDAISRVPMIWWGSNCFKQGHIVNEIVELVDIPNTLCQLAGESKMETADGLDMSLLLAGGNIPIHTLGVTEFAWSKSVRKGEFRYIYYQPDMFKTNYPQGFGELYNLQNDPWEMQNLYFDSDYKQIVNEFQHDLLHWLIRTNRPTTTLGLSKFNHTRLQSAQYTEVNDVVINSDNKFNPAILNNIKGSSYL